MNKVTRVLSAMSKTTGSYVLRHLAEGLSAVAARLEPKEAARLCGQAAATLTQAMGPLAQGLSAVSARLEPKDAAEVAATLIQAMSKTTDPTALHDRAQDLSAVLARELPPQTLVDLLEHPLCAGVARRLVLDRLGRHYRRPFADRWDFVRYAEEQKLGLDFTSRPRRT
jgi:hypothetical protein